MKSFILSAAVALFAAATAQAVTWNWQKVETGGAATGQVTLGTALDRTKGFALRMTINVTNVPASMNNSNWRPALISLSTSEHGTANMTVNMTESDGIRLDTKSGGTGSTKTTVKLDPVTKLTTGTHTVTLAYADGKLTLTYDDVQISTDYTLDYDPNLVAWGQQAGYPNDTQLNNGNQFDYEITSLQVATAAGPIPEPTALALLALGVAGMALRRRHVA